MRERTADKPLFLLPYSLFSLPVFLRSEIEIPVSEQISYPGDVVPYLVPNPSV